MEPGKRLLHILFCRIFLTVKNLSMRMKLPKASRLFSRRKQELKQAGHMLNRIKKLLESGESFAFETTLSTRSYVHFINRAKQLDYQVTCLFFWLDSEELAISRVENKLRKAVTIFRKKLSRGGIKVV